MKPGTYFWTSVACSTVLLSSACGTPFQLLNPRMPATHFTARPAESAFAREQLRHKRVRNARKTSQSRIEQLFAEKDIRYPASEVYLRVFKWERTLELWVRPWNGKQFELLKTYNICGMSGVVGPKLKQGDRQVPEGFYNVDVFNPASAYHLSLRVDYPNERDQAAKSDGVDLGGQIFIHGGCKSDGCLAITDEGIRELYWVLVEARGMGQQRIPVHIFPARFNDEDEMKKIERMYQKDHTTLAFWQTLKPGFYFFEKKRHVPNVEVDVSGKYRLADN